MVTFKEPEVTMPGTAARQWMTEEEFVAAFDEDIKAEWIDGEVILMSPASTRHVDLVGFLNSILRMFVVKHDLGAVYGPELQIRFEALRRRRVPDLLFVARERLDIIKANHVEGPPDLVIEVVSPDSPARDWREKYLEYEAAGVAEYWVIDPMAERMEVYALAEQEKYELVREENNLIHSTVLAGFFLKPAWLWPFPLPNPLEVLKELGVL